MKGRSVLRPFCCPLRGSLAPAQAFASEPAEPYWDHARTAEERAGKVTTKARFVGSRKSGHIVPRALEPQPRPLPRKDRWDILHVFLAPLGGLLTAIAVASLGVFGSRALERQQSNEAKLRLYSELMTRREESEATLRKEMFQSIIGSFFDPASTSLEVRLLKMELWPRTSTKP